MENRSREMQKLNFEYRFIAVYVIIGSLWIVFSDKLLGYFIKDPDLLTRFQTYKGWFYVFITAIVFYIILKKHLINLRLAETKARESDRLKTAFIHNISHEVRTPMNSIIGFSGLLNSNNLSYEKKEEYIKIINFSSYQLLDTVNGMLDISLLETGNLKISEKKVNLNKLIDDVFNSLLPLIKTGIDFSTEKGLPDQLSFIITDEAKIRKVISSLLNNSMKFTSKGKIIWGYVVKDDFLEFFIRDTGIGIPEDFQVKIFKSFQKSDEGLTGLNEGLGLGLTISKGLVELLKGKMWFESIPDKGSTFFFSIPFVPVLQHQPSS